MIKIAPSILSANFANLNKEISSINATNADLIHIDIMDGHYVPNITFGPDIVKTIRNLSNKILDVHLMIKPVKNFIENFIVAGADIISFHPEADTDPIEVIKLIKNHKCKVGIAIHPNVAIEEIKKFLKLIDIVVVMTVLPGFAGQKFMDNQISKISKLNDIKNQYKYDYEIEIDGGINNETAINCIRNGANILVAGSYIFNSNNIEYSDIIEDLRKN